MAIVRSAIIERALFDWRTKTLSIVVSKVATDDVNLEVLGQDRFTIEANNADAMFAQLENALIGRAQAKFPGWTVTVAPLAP